MFILNFTYPLRCLRVPPVEYHCHRAWLSSPKWSRNSGYFRHPNGSLQCSKVSATGPILCQMNPVYILEFNILFNIILTFMSRSPKWPPPFRISDGNFVCISHLFHACCTRVYPEVSGLAAWNENCKWYSFLLLCAVVSPFCESF
jgi:hypothetical protein